MSSEKIILNRLDVIENMLRKLLMGAVPQNDGVKAENDYIRAKRAALDAREKILEKRRLKNK